MTIVRNLLLILEVLTSVMLIGLVLIQKSKGGGLGGSAFGGAAETVFGARAGNFLTKATIILTVIFMVNTLALSFFFAGTQERSLIDEDPVVQDAPPVAPQVIDPVIDPVAPIEDVPIEAIPVEPVPAAE